MTAQGIRKSRREVSYAAAQLETSDVNVGRSPQLAQALSGKVTGLAIYNVNNSVDPAVKVVLRGYRSLTGNNEALVVLDGMQTTSTVLAIINPNDIESVSILKGGQAATLYGSAGINGAIIITTKQGTKGKLRVAYSNSTNFEQISFLPQFQDKYGTILEFSICGDGTQLCAVLIDIQGDARSEATLAQVNQQVLQADMTATGI